MTLPPQRRVAGNDTVFYLPLAPVRSGAGTLAISLTSEERSRGEALAMLNRRYAWRGYGADHKLSSSQHETTFTARLDGSLVGTVTLAEDSALGLGVDRTFPQETQQIRGQPHTRLCEMKKLALETASMAQLVLASLFNFIFLYATNNYLGTDLVIEVNPRHVSFYEKALGFRTLGAVKPNLSVNAPSQLMWLPVSAIEAAIEEREKADSNSLYRYFFSEEQQDMIVNHLNHCGLIESLDRGFP